MEGKESFKEAEPFWVGGDKNSKKMGKQFRRG